MRTLFIQCCQLYLGSMLTFACIDAHCLLSYSDWLVILGLNRSQSPSYHLVHDTGLPCCPYRCLRWKEVFASTKIPAFGLGFIWRYLYLYEGLSLRSIGMHLGLEPHKFEQLRQPTSYCALYITARHLCCFWRGENCPLPAG